MKLIDLQSIATRVEFRDWRPRFQEKADGFLFSWLLVDSTWKVYSTRKHYVSFHAVESEVVQTMLYAALQGVEHEAREDFKAALVLTDDKGEREQIEELLKILEGIADE